MTISEALEKRRSIRNFSSKPVSEELLLELARAGRLAPSASNLQAWQFFFLTDPELVKKVDLFSPGLSGHPPVILAICSDMGYAAVHGSPNSERYGCIMDAAMAAENIMLKAADLGLGTCAIKSYNDAAVRKLLKLPEDYRIELLISLGYPEGENPSFQRMAGGSMRQEDYFELLVYMITSAAGLKGEPKIYGPLRMIEASERLCSLMLKEDPDNPDLKELREIIETGKQKTTSDEEGFYQMLQDAAAKLVDMV